MTNFESTATKRISYILATKNRAPFLEKALTGYRALITSADELIIIDGGSTDDTLQVLARFSDLVKTVVSEPDVSEGHADNKGVLLARGTYIKLLTDDDVFYPEAIAQAVRVMDEHPDVDMLVCGGTKTRGNKSGTVWLPPGTNYGASVEDVFRYWGCGLGFLIRRSVFANVGLFNSRCISLDNDFLAQSIARGATVKFCRINMYHHFIEDHSGMVKKQKALERDVKRIVKQYCTRSFYFKYLWSEWYRARKTHPGWKWMFLPWRIIRKLVRMMKKQRASTLMEYIWDGGFS